MQNLSRRSALFHWILRSTFAVAGIFLSHAASAQVVQGSYKLPAAIDPAVASGTVTELWAQVYRPPATIAGPYPLVVFLHGNHATCGRFDASLGIRIDDRIDYTSTGTCPSGYVVTPNHLGYRYLATDLASRGYLVVSINANRGVNAAPGVSGDSGLNLRRGRLVLRHLEELSKWSRGVAATPSSLGFSLQGLLDYGHIGLMGHSRGGEGMRAAVAQYKDAGSPWPARIVTPAKFEALFEIGPVDGQTSRVLNAVDMQWNVLLPGCDGDVSNLQGVKPLDRMLQITTETASFRKSSFQVFGANHNFYNSQWQESDASGCNGQTAIFPQLLGSQPQRVTASKTLVPFFRANVGANKLAAYARIFDPSYPLPTNLTSITAYARGFTPTPRASQNFVIDNFDQSTGTSSRSVPNTSSGLSSYVHGSASTTSHDATQRAARVSWNTAGGFLQVNASNAGSPLDVQAFRTLEFRVMLDCPGSLCSSNPNPTGDVDFSIALANSDGSLSSAATLKSLAVVRRPVGSTFGGLNRVFQTVRAPLSLFAGANLASFRGVRFTFNGTNSSAVFLGNVRLTKSVAGPGGLPAAALAAPAVQIASNGAFMPAAAAETNRIVGIRQTVAPAAAGGGGPVVEIEVASSRAFPVGGALPTLEIGGRTFTLSRFASGKTDRLIFTLDPAEFAALPNGAPVSVRVGAARPWPMGALAKP